MRARNPNNLVPGSLDVRRNQRELNEEALQRFRGNRRRAAEALSMSTVTLWRKVRRHGLQVNEADGTV